MFNKNLFLTLALSLPVFGLVSGDEPGTPVNQGTVIAVPDAPVRVAGDLHQDLNDNPVARELFQAINQDNRQALQQEFEDLVHQILETEVRIGFANNQEHPALRAQLVRLQAQLAVLQAQLVA